MAWASSKGAMARVSSKGAMACSKCSFLLLPLSLEGKPCDHQHREQGQREVA